MEPQPDQDIWSSRVQFIDPRRLVSNPDLFADIRDQPEGLPQANASPIANSITSHPQMHYQSGDMSSTQIEDMDWVGSMLYPQSRSPLTGSMEFTSVPKTPQYTAPDAAAVPGGVQQMTEQHAEIPRLIDSQPQSNGETSIFDILDGLLGPENDLERVLSPVQPCMHSTNRSFSAANESQQDSNGIQTLFVPRVDACSLVPLATRVCKSQEVYTGLPKLSRTVRIAPKPASSNDISIPYPEQHNPAPVKLGIKRPNSPHMGRAAIPTNYLVCFPTDFAAQAQSNSEGQPSLVSKRMRRAPRAPRACLRCQIERKKCDGEIPCGRCQSLKHNFWTACVEPELESLDPFRGWSKPHAFFLVYSYIPIQDQLKHPALADIETGRLQLFTLCSRLNSDLFPSMTAEMTTILASLPFTYMEIPNYPESPQNRFQRQVNIPTPFTFDDNYEKGTLFGLNCASMLLLLACSQDLEKITCINPHVITLCKHFAWKQTFERITKLWRKYRNGSASSDEARDLGVGFILILYAVELHDTIYQVDLNTFSLTLSRNRSNYTIHQLHILYKESLDFIHARKLERSSNKTTQLSLFARFWIRKIFQKRLHQIVLTLRYFHNLANLELRSSASVPESASRTTSSTTDNNLISFSRSANYQAAGLDSDSNEAIFSSESATVIDQIVYRAIKIRRQLHGSDIQKAETTLREFKHRNPIAATFLYRFGSNNIDTFRQAFGEVVVRILLEELALMSHPRDDVNDCEVRYSLRKLYGKIDQLARTLPEIIERASRAEDIREDNNEAVGYKGKGKDKN